MAGQGASARAGIGGRQGRRQPIRSGGGSSPVGGGVVRTSDGADQSAETAGPTCLARGKRRRHQLVPVRDPCREGDAGRFSHRSPRIYSVERGRQFSSLPGRGLSGIWSGVCFVRFGAARGALLRRKI